MVEDLLDLPQKIGMLFERFDTLVARMEALENDRLVSLSDLKEALKGLRVEMDGRDVGEIIDERLGELYDMRENGVI